MQGGEEQHIPPQAAVMTFGRPVLSYVPMTSTGAGYRTAFGPSDFLDFSVFLHHAPFRRLTASLRLLSAATLSRMAFLPLSSVPASRNPDSSMAEATISAG